MTDAVTVFSPADHLDDNNGNPLANGTIEFYNAGTSTPKTVYSDNTLSTSLGTTVSTNASGYPVTGGGAETLIYVGTADYKIIVKDSGGSTLRTRDNIKGAVSVPPTSEIALPETPVVSKPTTYPIVAADQSKVINANPTTGSFAITLLSAITAGDGFRITIRHNANTTNVVTIRTTGGETISIPGKSVSAFTLKGWGESVQLVSDGANWHADASTPPLLLDSGTFQTFSVTDRLTTPPTSPTGGARYIINGSPTGVWSTLGFAANQVAESDGNGSWFSYPPQAGWMAYVVDEDLFTKYDGASWEDQTGMGTPSTRNLKQFLAINSQADGTSGGNATSGSWAAISLGLAPTVASPITGASLATSQITLPTGNYLVLTSQPFYGTFLSRTRFRSTTTATVIYSDTVQAGITAVGPLDVPTGATAVGIGTVTVSGATETFAFEYFCSQTRTGGLGQPSSSTGVTETYAQVLVIDLASLQGPRGAQGPQGPTAGVLNTRTAAIAASIDASVDVITTGGYTTAGDGGGGTYKRVGSAPAHGVYFQSADGAYWELVANEIWIEQAGGGTGVVSNTTALNNCALYVASTPICNTIRFQEGTYAFGTKPTNFTSCTRLVGSGNGATKLKRNYSEGGALGFLTWQETVSRAINGSEIENIHVYAEDGTTGGYAVHLTTGVNIVAQFWTMKASSKLGQRDPAGTGIFLTTMYVDGSANQTVSSQGWRDVVIEDGAWLWPGSSGYAFVGTNLTNARLNGRFQGDLYITGGGTSTTNTSSGLYDGVVTGNVLLEQCSGISLNGQIAGNLTISSTCTTSTVSASIEGTITNNSTSTYITNFKSGSGFYVAGRLIAANFNSTADQAITLRLPSQRYRVNAITVSNPSASFAASVAQGGVYVSAGKTNAIVSSSQLYTALTNATSNTSGSLLLMTLSSSNTTVYDATTIYFSLTTAHGSSITADVTVLINPLP